MGDRAISESQKSQFVQRKRKEAACTSLPDGPSQETEDRGLRRNHESPDTVKMIPAPKAIGEGIKLSQVKKVKHIAAKGTSAGW